MQYCPTCSHFHGQDGGWVKCLAITTTEAGGARRCACSGPKPSN